MPVDQILHAGGEGTVLINSVDYSSNGWDGTETAEASEYTGTKQFYPGDGAHGKTYQARWPTKWSMTGSTKFKYDSNAQPFPNCDAGAIVALKLFMAYQGSNLQIDKALITSAAVSNGGMNEVFDITINWEAQGRYVKN